MKGAAAKWRNFSSIEVSFRLNTKAEKQFNKCMKKYYKFFWQLCIQKRGFMTIQLRDPQFVADKATHTVETNSHRFLAQK